MAERRHLQWVGVLATLVGLPVLSAGYVWDDFALLGPGGRLTGTGSLLRAWMEPLWLVGDGRAAPPFWRPLACTLLKVEATVLQPAAMHAVQLSLHVGAVLLLRTLGRDLGLSAVAATLAASAFAVSPSAPEAFCWLSAQGDVAGLTLALAVLLGACRGVPRRWLFLGALAAALCKEGFALLPLWLVALPRGARDHAWPPLAAAAACWGLGWCLVVYPHGPYVWDPWIPPPLRVAGVLSYLLISPVGHRVQADFLSPPAPVPVLLACLGVVLMFFVAASRLPRARGLVIATGVALLPGLYPLLTMGGKFHDRYLYAPAALLALAGGVLTDRLFPRSQRAISWVGIALLGVYGVCAAAQADRWADPGIPRLRDPMPGEVIPTP